MRDDMKTNDPVSHPSDPTRLHVAVYRRLLALFPSEFRRAYEEPMAQLFRDQCRETQRRAAPLGMAALWVRTLLDTGKAAGREHLTRFRQRLKLQSVKDPLRTSLMNSPIPSRYRAAWRLIPAGILVGIAASAVFAFIQPNEYRSTSVLITTPKISVGSASGAAAEIRESLNSVDTTLAMMQNDAVIERVITRLRDGRDNSNKLVRPELSAAPGAGGTFIMTVTSANFEYARRFVTAWAAEFVDFQRTQRISLMNESSARIQQNILTFQKKLDQAQQSLDDFQKKNNIATVEDAGSRAQQRLDKAKLEFANLLAEIQEVENTTAEQLARLSPSSHWMEYKLEVKRAENRLAAATNDAALKAELALRQADLKSLIEVTEETRLAKHESLKRRAMTYPKLIEDFTAQVFDATQPRAELLRLQQEESRVRQQLDELNASQLNLIRMSSDVDRFSILSAGGGDSRPVGPNRQMILFTGFTLGALVGLALALLRVRFGGPPDSGTPSSTAAVAPVPLGA